MLFFSNEVRLLKLYLMQLQISERTRKTLLYFQSCNIIKKDTQNSSIYLFCKYVSIKLIIVENWGHLFWRNIVF